MRGSSCEQCYFKTFCRVMHHCMKVQVKNEIPNDHTKEIKNLKQTWKTLRSLSPYVCPWWPPPGPPWCRAPLLLSLPSSRCPPETLQCIHLHLMFPSFGGDEETLMYVWLFVCLFLILSKSPICTEECFAINWTIVIFWPLKVKLKYTGVQSQ